MAYTLEDIRQRVLVDKLDDDEFNEGVVTNFINDTQRDIFNQYELRFQEKIFEGTVPSGFTMFKYPDDVALPLAHVITGPDGGQMDIKDRYLDFRTFNEKFPTPANNPAGNFGYWTLFGNNMIFSNKLSEDHSLNIFYIKKPTTLANGGDTPDVPEEFQELLVLGAFRRIQQRNEDFDLATVTDAEYSRMLDLLVNRYGARKADGPIKMKNKQRG